MTRGAATELGGESPRGEDIDRPVRQSERWKKRLWEPVSAGLFDMEALI